MSLQFNTNTIDYLQKYLTLQHTLKDFYKTFKSNVLYEYEDEENILPEYLKDFYMDSWFSEDDYDKDEFPIHQLDNIVWYCKSHEEKELILDDDMDDYFRVF